MPPTRKKMTSLRVAAGEKLICKIADGQEREYLAYPGDLMIAAIPDIEPLPVGWTSIAWLDALGLDLVSSTGVNKPVETRDRDRPEVI